MRRGKREERDEEMEEEEEEEQIHILLCSHIVRYYYVHCQKNAVSSPLVLPLPPLLSPMLCSWFSHSTTLGCTRERKIGGLEETKNNTVIAYLVRA